MDQCIGKAVDVAISPLVSLVPKHLTYLLKAEDNLDKLKKVAADLAARRKDVEERVRSGCRTTGGTATNEVSKWLEGAERIEAGAEALDRRYAERKRCLGGCSVHFWSIYAIGKSADKMTQDARLEFDRGVFEQVVVVPAGRHDKSEIDNPPPGGRQYHRYLDQALEFINDDAVEMVGIWGMGGVGKTHLLNSINNSFARQTSFDVVIFVTASRECPVERIQRQIVEKLKLTQENNTEKNNEDPARIISDFLREKNFLLLLDDLWEQLDLVAVGIPMPSAAGKQHKRKVVLTTRFLKVCGQMGVSKGNSITVECLDDEDAWLLFQKNASCSTAVEALARKVARKLGGLPLALITVGRAMYDKEDPREWRHAIDLLQDARHDEVDPDAKEESLFHTLKFSYDRLRSDALRDCLLCCSLWPEDFCIPKYDLILCLLGLGVIDGFDNMQSAYNIGYDLIASLRSACLLNNGNLSFGVRVHDVIRDMALWIACDCGKRKKKWFVKAGLGPMEELLQGTGIVWGETDRVSLMYNRIEAFRDSPGRSNSPAALTTLMLQWNLLSEISLAASPSLATLAYLDLSFNRLNCFPEDICRLTALRYLNLSSNQIPELPAELKLLTSLKYLILRNTNVQTVPAGVIRELKALQMLDLHGCLYTVDLKYLPSLFGELEALNNLKALGINVNDVNQLNRLDELQRTRIWSLYIFDFKQTTLPLGSSRIQNSLFDLQIADSTTLEEIVFDAGRSNRNPCFHNLEKLSFDTMLRLNIVVLDRLVAREVFPRLCTLEFSFCKSLKDVSWIMHLPCLRTLDMFACESATQLISCTENDDGKGEVVAAPTFPSLQRISLVHLPALQCVCDPACTFPCLEQFGVKACERLMKLPFRADTIPKSLKFISCDKTWWERIEWEDDVHRSSLQPFFQIR